VDYGQKTLFGTVRGDEIGLDNLTWWNGICT